MAGWLAGLGASKQSGCPSPQPPRQASGPAPRTLHGAAQCVQRIWSAVRMHGAQLSRSTYAHCAPRRSALPCGQNGSCRRHMLCPLCAQHSMLHALRPMRVALHICAPIYLVCCAACMRHGTMCCMPLQVRSAALRRIYMQRTKVRYPSIPNKKYRRQPQK